MPPVQEVVAPTTEIGNLIDLDDPPPPVEQAAAAAQQVEEIQTPQNSVGACSTVPHDLQRAMWEESYYRVASDNNTHEELQKLIHQMMDLPIQVAPYIEGTDVSVMYMLNTMMKGIIAILIQVINRHTQG